MSVKHAILGFLSWRPLTGYDLKKMFVDSSFIYWSGNNNQIYKALIELHQDGFVVNEIQHQDKAPSRKIYTVTEKGSDELRQWILSTPEMPLYRNTFLIQLAWADQLEASELNGLLDTYEHGIYMQLLMSEEQRKRNSVNPSRTKREAVIWSMVAENQVSAYRAELEWVRRLRGKLNEMQ
jgi:PadR family transcriptional regulator AphA